MVFRPIGTLRIANRFLFGMVLVCGWGGSTDAFAGGGPENVFLVVNSASTDSMTVANHYIDLRQIPTNNVFYLNYRGSKANIPSKKFREEILLPILSEIENRKLVGQIDYIVYSCDFPWRIDFKGDFPDEQFPPQLRPHASITAATFLWAFVKEKRKEMFSLNTNFYCAPPGSGVTISRGFRSQYRWSVGGKRAGAQGLPYMLSAMLGVTFGRGNTVDEIAWYLNRASEADGTSPRGTVYYMQNKTQRSVVRDESFPGAVKELGLAGVRAKILEGAFPEGAQDIAGLTSGHHQLEVGRARSRFLPGAMCDNLTSAGGQFYNPKSPPGQTCISEFLRLGAAGACGTVVEPYAIPQKFPSATLHVHYARGCSLAEAFYQSVAGPYQQILVGDPLCQPWASTLEVSVDGISDGETLRGTVEFAPQVSSDFSAISPFRLFINGIKQRDCRPGEMFTLDTTDLADGYHELRIVATESTPIETQGRWIGHVVVKNGRDAVQLTLDEQSLTSVAGQLSVESVATSSLPLTVTCNGREIGKIADGNGTISIAKADLGSGPLNLVAIGEGAPGLRARPVRVVLP